MARALRSSNQNTPVQADRAEKTAASKSATRTSNRKKPPKQSDATPTKSQYFKKDALADDVAGESASELSDDPEVSGYEDEDISEDIDSSEDEDYASEESQPARKWQKTAASRKGSQPTKSGVSAAKGKELWRNGVKAGLGPGRVAIIAKPKARTAGSTPYADGEIHPNTMLFLEELAENNDREWLKAHDPDYRQSWQDFMSFLEKLQDKIIEIDQTVPELPLKDVIFRIYRDVRFSPDPTPYKAYFSACFSRTGRKGPFAVYYVQIKPGGQSMVGGGLWMPEAAALAALRRDIDRKPENIKRVLTNARIRREFFGGVPNDAKKAVREFAKHNSENALKTKPKGFESDHENIELLRLRNFVIGRKLKDDEVIGSGAQARIASLVETLLPFVTYLNSVVMPDETENASETDGSSESASEAHEDSAS